MENNLITLSDLAKELGTNKQRLYRIMKRITSTYGNDYLISETHHRAICFDRENANKLKEYYLHAEPITSKCITYAKRNTSTHDTEHDISDDAPKTDDEMIELIKKELANKDEIIKSYQEQLKIKDEQIQRSNDMVDRMQELLSNQQKLTAITQKKETGVTDEITEGTTVKEEPTGAVKEDKPVKRSFIQRLFNIKGE